MSEVIEFPSARGILWDRTPIEEPFFLRANDVFPPIYLTSSVVSSVLYQLNINPRQNFDCKAVAVSVSSLCEEELVTLRQRPMLSALGASGNVLHVCDTSIASNSATSASLLTIPFAPRPFGDLLFDEDTTSKLLSNLAKAIKTNKETSLRSVMRVRAFGAAARIQSSLNGTVRFEAILPEKSFQVLKVRPIPVLQTPLSIKLLRRRHQQQAASPSTTTDENYVGPRVGFLTLNQTRKLVPVLEADPSLSRVPLVGVWTALDEPYPGRSGAAISNPLAWAACIRYLYCDHIKDRALVAPETFLLVNFGSLSFDCYEVTLLPSKLGVSNRERQSPSSGTTTSSQLDEFVCLDFTVDLAADERDILGPSSTSPRFGGGGGSSIDPVIGRFRPLMNPEHIRSFHSATEKARVALGLGNAALQTGAGVEAGVAGSPRGNGINLRASLGDYPAATNYSGHRARHFTDDYEVKTPIPRDAVPQPTSISSSSPTSSSSSSSSMRRSVSKHSSDGRGGSLSSYEYRHADADTGATGATGTAGDRNLNHGDDSIVPPPSYSDTIPVPVATRTRPPTHTYTSQIRSSRNISSSAASASLPAFATTASAPGAMTKNIDAARRHEGGWYFRGKEGDTDAEIQKRGNDGNNNSKIYREGRGSEQVSISMYDSVSRSAADFDDADCVRTSTASLRTSISGPVNLAPPNPIYPYPSAAPPGVQMAFPAEVILAQQIQLDSLRRQVEDLKQLVLSLGGQLPHAARPHQTSTPLASNSSALTTSTSVRESVASRKPSESSERRDREDILKAGRQSAHSGANQRTVLGAGADADVSMETTETVGTAQDDSRLDGEDLVGLSKNVQPESEAIRSSADAAQLKRDSCDSGGEDSRDDDTDGDHAERLIDAMTAAAEESMTTQSAISVASSISTKRSSPEGKTRTSIDAAATVTPRTKSGYRFASAAQKSRTSPHSRSPKVFSFNPLEAFHPDIPALRVANNYDDDDNGDYGSPARDPAFRGDDYLLKNIPRNVLSGNQAQTIVSSGSRSLGNSRDMLETTILETSAYESASVLAIEARYLSNGGRS